ncbi:MAG: hypothetical protein H7Z75_07065 [Ferruginibacter sp.]|nr:hypothetical protein [Cytophagales bacterium]
MGLLRGQAYGVSVAKEVARQTGRQVSIAAVHVARHRLAGKELVNSREAGGNPSLR